MSFGDQMAGGLRKETKAVEAAEATLTEEASEEAPEEASGTKARTSQSPPVSPIRTGDELQPIKETTGLAPKKSAKKRGLASPPPQTPPNEDEDFDDGRVEALRGLYDEPWMDDDAMKISSSKSWMKGRLRVERVIPRTKTPTLLGRETGRNLEKEDTGKKDGKTCSRQLAAVQLSLTMYWQT